MSHLLCGQADMSPRAGSAYTNQRWMFAEQTGNVTIVASPRFINQAFLQSDTLIEVDDSHVMEIDDCRLLPVRIGRLKFEYFHALDIPEKSSLRGLRWRGGD